MRVLAILYGLVLTALSLVAVSITSVHFDWPIRVSAKSLSQVRSDLLSAYEDQLMDNLIRAREAQLIIQLEFDASNLGAAKPVRDWRAYDAYLSYLDAERNPGSLMVTRDPPHPGQAHIWRKFKGQYYWVPVEYRKLFFQLALVTTVQRGKALQEPDKFYVVTLKDPLKLEGNPIFPGSGYVLTFDIDKQKIPIDDGYLTLDSDKAGTGFPIETIGSANSSTAGFLRVMVPNDPITFELGESAAARPPTGGRNLIYVSDANDMLTIRIFDGESNMVVDSDESRIPVDQKNKVGALKTRLKALKPPYKLTGRERTEIVNIATAIVGYDPNTLKALFKPLPQTGKLHLRHNAPKAPTTEDALSRVNFLHQ